MLRTKTKLSLKKEILKKRDRLDDKTVRSLSERIFDKVFASECYRQCKNVLIYNSFNNEVRTGEAIFRMLKEKNVYLPRINAADNLEAVKINVNTEYALNRFGIYEPCGSASADSVIELAIIPGVVFDKMGGRTGYGKAYYDMFLRGKDIYKLAVCFDFQIAECVPTDLFDVNMDCIITENNIYTIRRFEKNG